MTSMEVSFGDSQSPYADPTSFATEPSSPSTAAAVSRPAGNPATEAQSAPRTKVTRTYGRKVVDDVTPPQLDILAGRTALESHSTVVIPDSEPGLKFPQSPSSESMDGEGDETMRAAGGRARSSPTRRDIQSTDPTSEEEEPVQLAGARSKTTSRAHIATDSESSDEEAGAGAGSDEDDLGALAHFKRRPALKDLLADVDREFDARPQDDQVTSVPLPISSSLPPLTITNESDSSRPASSSQRSPRRRRDAPASSPSHDLDDIERLLQSTQTLGSEESAPTAPTRTHKVRAILDSDDSDNNDSLPYHTSKSSSLVHSASSGDESDEGDVHPALSKKDRVRQLWQKKVQANEAKERERNAKLAAARGEEYTERASTPAMTVEDLIADDSGGKARKKSAKALKPKEKQMKSLSKKELEEMNRVTAALNRQQDARLEATRKVGLSVAEALKQHSLSSLPAPSIDRVTSAHAPPATITLSSSSDAIVSSSPLRDVAQTPVPRLSSKALGKQRATSPIADGDHDTPVPHRVRIPPVPAGWPERRLPAAENEGPDEELLAPDEVIRRDTEKREKARRMQELQEKKRAALTAAKAAAVKAAQDESDSDLEIELPGAASKSKRSSSPLIEDTLAAFARTPARSRNDPRKILARNAGIDLRHPPSDTALPSESQLDAAGHEFGRHLDTRFHENLTSSTRKSRSSKPVATTALRGVPEITRESHNDSMLERARRQALATRIKKESLDRARKQQQYAAQRAGQQELQSVDVNALIKSKREKEEQEAEREEEEDADYVAEDDEGGDLLGSTYDGSDAEEREGMGSEEEESDSRYMAGSPAEDEEADSDGELVMPRSSQNSERNRQATQDGDPDEDADEDMPPPATTRRATNKIRIAADDDEELAVSDTPALTELAPTELAKTADTATQAEPAAKVAFGGLLGDIGDTGGFSQFFDSQFSQGGAGEKEGEGFLRAADEEMSAPAPTLFAAQPLISTAERAADAARLEARGGFNDFEPTTPRELPAPRQYINDKGFLTQTRPNNLFDSPSDSPGFFRQTLSTRDSQSQILEETQIASAQTPTQFSKDATSLRRADALTSFESLAPLLATEVESQAANKSTVGAGETQDTQDALPSAAQPTTSSRSAFDALKAGAEHVEAPVPMEQKPRRRMKNAFVDAEANLSDEEVGLGLGGVSGDEDEEGHDAELESLVDNEEVDRDLQDEQDTLARDRFREDEDKAEAEAMKRAQRVVDGKERQKRGAYDLSDDDFDDEYVSRHGHREKKARVDSQTIEQLRNAEETQAFGNILAQGFVPTAKVGEYAFLETPQALSDDDDEGDGDGMDGGDLDGGAQDVFGRVDAPEVRVRSFRDAQQLAIQRSRAKKALEEQAQDMGMLELEEAEFDGVDDAFDERLLRNVSPDIHLGLSSSPVAPLKVNSKHTTNAATTTVPQAAPADEFADLDSQLSVFGVQHSTTVKYSERDESSVTTATVGGNRSSVTSFKRTSVATSTSAVAGGRSISKGGKAGTTLGPRPSKLAAVRKGGFA